MDLKFGTEEGTFGALLHAKFHPHRCNVSPLRGEKTQNRPLSKLNTGRFALCAMLPVIKEAYLYICAYYEFMRYLSQALGHARANEGHTFIDNEPFF